MVTDTIDGNKIVFIAIDWMKNYRGITDNDKPLGTASDYPREKKHEVYNFLCDDDGNYYGHTIPEKMDLKRICNNKNEIKICHDDHDREYLENVLVIFCGKKKKNNDVRKLIGFYIGAKIFNKPYLHKERKIKSTNESVIYSAISRNVFLIEEIERNIYIPYSRKDGYGFGQANIWYADINDQKIEGNKVKKMKDFRDGIVNRVKLIMETFNNEDFNEQRRIQEANIATDEEAKNSVYKKPEYKENGPNKIPKREDKIAKKVLNDADYICQIDHTHKTFITKQKVQYMEGHHLIPCTKTNSEKFWIEKERNIDCYENIVCICPTCHRAVHFGDWDTKKRIIEELFKNQEKRLRKVGIEITKEQLFELYV